MTPATKSAPARGSRAAGVRFSALIVNYNSGAFACGCVASLRAEWQRAGRDPADLEIVVVDNASPRDQSEWLARLARDGVRVVQSKENGGYAKGMNLALAHTSGGPGDVVGILNPDLCFLPGSLGRLLDWLAEHPECGAVDPKTAIDPELVMQLPPNALPTLGEHVCSILAQLHPALSRAYSRRRVRFAHPWWLAEQPLRARMLSGCCMLLRRSVVEQLGVLLDERYPLYYEDADLCRRLTAQGYELVHHTDAVVLHHWTRSSGVGEDYRTENMRRYWISQRAYFRRFYGVLGSALIGAVNGLAERWPASWRFRPMHAIVELGTHAEPLTIELPRACSFCMELSMAPTWILAVGMFGSGDRWVCPPRTWEWMFQAEYFLRAIDLATGEVLGAWHCTKSVPGRELGLTTEEVESLLLPSAGAARERAS